MKHFLFLVFILCLIGACKTDVKPADEEEKSTVAISAPQEVVGETYPSFPAEEAKILWDSADYVDIIFYYEDFSISQKHQKDIRGMLNYISQGTPKINPACQAIGRIFFQIEGRNAAEADIYFSQGCTYFIFYKNGKKTYANGFSESGVNFFNNIFASVKAQKPK